MSPTARFTPRMLDEQSLEQSFVNREEMLIAAVERIREAAESGRRSHVLYAGPRGAGKTHLISLIYHRAKRLEGFQSRFALSWLPEDTWRIISFESLMAEIARNSEPPLDGEQDGPPLTVVLIENLDHVFSSLRTEGQRQLRAYLEQREDMLLVATSTRLTDYMIEQAQPFYGFFDTIELKPFTLDESIAMLQRSAELRGDRSLVTRLGEPDTRARLAAVERLAGGQPRIWALLATGLTIENLKDFVDHLLESFDDLTPYYQEQLARLSPNELRAVLALIDADGAMSVQALSNATGIEQRSLATTLRGLRPHWIVPREGYLTRFVDKRSTYYQLAEPLARLVFQIKETKGRPVKLAVDFLAAWYSRDELDLAIGMTDGRWQANAVADNLIFGYMDEARSRMHSSHGRFYEHLAGGLPTLRFAERYPAKPDEGVIEECVRVDEALTSFQRGGSADALFALPAGITDSLEEQLQEHSVGMLRIEIALLAVRCGGEERWLQSALDATGALRAEEERTAQLALGSIRFLLGQAEAGFATFDSALARDDATLTAREWELIATTVSRPVRPLSASTRIELLRRVVAFVGDVELPSLVAFSLEETRLSKASEQLLNALSVRISKDEHCQATTIDGLLEVLSLNADLHDLDWLVPRARIAWWRYRSGDLQRAREELAEVVTEAKAHPDFELAKRLELQADLAGIEIELGVDESAIDALRGIVAEATQALGPDHIKTLLFRSNLAYRIGEANRTDEAIELYTSLLEDCMRILGPDHPETLRARHNLAYRIGEANRTDEAIDLFASLLEDCMRVLGPDHPNTLTTRSNLDYLIEKVILLEES